MSDKTYAERFDRATAQWFKSTRSNGGGGNCVEACRLADGGMAIRDSKDPAGPILFFTPDEWKAFIGGAKDGEFDR
jgi:hypothetical protein